jgi:uncharacterized protein (DUF1778 family)
MNPSVNAEKLVGRLSVRVRSDDETLIRKAAALSDARSLSQFLIRSALIQARIDLADRKTFVVRPDQVDEFYQALDDVSAPNEALQALLAGKTQLEH